jgi:Copper resistance protein D
LCERRRANGLATSSALDSRAALKCPHRPTVLRGERGGFWSATIRRFSIAAMSCVGVISLSELWLYWSHIDGPTQLLTTMYGRVLGVKILIFGTMLLLGMVNQFWLHPRIDALRAGGDERALLTILMRRFPAIVAVEVLLGPTVLMVAPFLHGSARNQAFQAEAAKQAISVTAVLPKIPAKEVTTSTWVWGASGTVAVAGVMIIGFAVSGRIAHRRVLAVAAPP